MAPSKKTPFIAEIFEATGKDGTRQQLRLWRWKIEQPMLNGETSVVFADWKIETTDGRPVNREPDGALSFADTGERLTRL